MTESLGRRVFREKRGLILVLLALALANAAFFAGVIYPLQRRVASADQRAAAAAAELATAEREHQRAVAVVEGKQRAETELRRFYDQILPASQSDARRMTYRRLAELARDANLDFDHRTFAVKDVRDSSLRRLEIVMLLQGSYGDIRRFVYALEKGREFVVITGIDVVQREQDSAGLELTIQLATYYQVRGDGS